MSARSSPGSSRRRKTMRATAAVALREIAAAARGISRRPGLHLRRSLSALSPASLVARRAGGVVIKSFRAFPHDAAADETLERPQRPVIFRRYETDCVADGLGAPGPSDAVNVVLRVHRKIVVHHVRNPVDIDPARG